MSFPIPKAFSLFKIITEKYDDCKKINNILLRYGKNDKLSSLILRIEESHKQIREKLFVGDVNIKIEYLEDSFCYSPIYQKGFFNFLKTRILDTAFSIHFLFTTSPSFICKSNEEEISKFYISYLSVRKYINVILSNFVFNWDSSKISSLEKCTRELSQSFSDLKLIMESFPINKIESNDMILSPYLVKKLSRSNNDPVFKILQDFSKNKIRLEDASNSLSSGKAFLVILGDKVKKILAGVERRLENGDLSSLNEIPEYENQIMKAITLIVLCKI